MVFQKGHPPYPRKGTTSDNPSFVGHEVRRPTEEQLRSLEAAQPRAMIPVGALSDTAGWLIPGIARSDSWMFSGIKDPWESNPEESVDPRNPWAVRAPGL